MDYFFTSICPGLMAVIYVVLLILEAINHLNKKMLVERVLQSEEKRQRYFRMNSVLVATYKRIFWQMLIVLPLLAIALYFFIPNLFSSLLPLMIEMVLFIILVLDDYLYRKSFLKAIDTKTERDVL